MELKPGDLVRVKAHGITSYNQLEELEGEVEHVTENNVIVNLNVGILFVTSRDKVEKL